MDASRGFRSIIVQLLSEGGYGDASSISNRMLSQLSTMDAVDYSYHLAEGFGLLECIYYLPNALSFMRETKPDYGRVGASVVRFTKVWHDELAGRGLLHALVRELAAAFRVWVETFHPAAVIVRDERGAIAPSLDALPIPAVDLFLDELLAAEIATDVSTAFDKIFRGWSDRPYSAEASATFLDFALRVRYCPGSERLYRSPAVLHAVFDECSLLSHWKLASACIRTRCDSLYVSAVGELLISRKNAAIRKGGDH